MHFFLLIKIEDFYLVECIVRLFYYIQFFLKNFAQLALILANFDVDIPILGASILGIQIKKEESSLEVNNNPKPLVLKEKN